MPKKSMGTERPKIDGEMTYLEKKNIDEAISRKLRKKDVYELVMHKIYNLFTLTRRSSDLWVR